MQLFLFILNRNLKQVPFLPFISLIEFNNYQKTVAMSNPTPMQSTNTTHRISFKKPVKWMPSVKENPMEETAMKSNTCTYIVEDEIQNNIIQLADVPLLFF